ncbi:hypothetical protein VE04_03932 [Pseudogymnoascus sp. 24MN13]|nr:hypothetical protein VE04_03932 [Pseudogymnoascus sp. 24MN13]
MSNRRPRLPPKPGNPSGQEKSDFPQPSQSLESRRQTRHAPKELVWTEPRTIPAAVHKNAPIYSTPPNEILLSRDGEITDLMKPLCALQDGLAQSWKTNSEFLDLENMSDVADDLDDVQSFFNYPTPLPVVGPVTTRSLESMDQQSYQLHLSSNQIGSHIQTSNSEDMSDNSSPSCELARLNGFSAVHLAAYFGKLSIIRLVLSTSPEDADLLNNNAQAPLHIAASEGHAEVVGELLRLGANATQQDNDGRTVLHVAVLKGRLNIVRLLLRSVDAQGIISMADNAGKTPLHLAVMQGRNQIVQVLLERGANTRTPIR